MAKKVYQEQQLTIILNCYIDLSSEVGNTAIQIKDPNGEIITFPADIVSPATNGQISYTFPIGYLIPGDYTVQALLISQNAPGESFKWHVFERFF